MYLWERSEINFYMILVILYYFIPLFIQDTGSAMFILLFLLPLVIFVGGFLLGRKNGLHIRPVAIVTLFFIPTIYFFYNSSAWIYPFLYGGIMAAGLFLGNLIKKGSGPKA